MGDSSQGCADFAFEQHIQKSLDDYNGRSICLWPQGLLDRNSEEDIRRNFLLSDRLEAVIGLGRNLFYNSGMESCLMISKTNKSEQSKGKVIFINAFDLVRKEKTISYLDDDHIATIYNAYKEYTSKDGLSSVVEIDEIIKNRSSLNINLYVNKYDEGVNESFSKSYDKWAITSDLLTESMDSLFKTLS